jgi:hypothetical protein
VIVIDLFHDPARRSYAAMPEMDPLTEKGALQEAALVDVRLNVVESWVAVLFDLRMALQLRTGNVGLLIAREVQRVDWADGRLTGFPRIWHAVTGSDPDNRHGRFGLRLGFASNAELVIDALAAEFYVGDVPGLDEAPPDFMQDTEAVIQAGMPGWESIFVPGFATFLDPSGSL